MDYRQPGASLANACATPYQEDQHANAAEMYEPIGSRHSVPARIGVRVVSIAAAACRCKAQEVLREEQHVHADEGDPEMQLAEELGVHVAGHFREPVIPGGKDSEDGAERQHVVEVRHHIIGVVE